MDYSNFLNRVVEISEIQLQEFESPCLSFKTDHDENKIHYNLFFSDNGRLCYSYKAWEGSSACGFVGFNFEVNLPSKSF